MPGAFSALSCCLRPQPPAREQQRAASDSGAGASSGPHLVSCRTKGSSEASTSREAGPQTTGLSSDADCGQFQLLTADGSSAAAAARAGARRGRFSSLRNSLDDDDSRGSSAPFGAGTLSALLKRFSLEEVCEAAMREPQHAPGLVSFSELAQSLSGLSWLGEGANGLVYTASWHGSLVALKLVLVDASATDFVARSCGEAIVTRQLSHPSVVQCFAVGFGMLTPEALQGIAEACPEEPMMGSRNQSTVWLEPQASLSDPRGTDGSLCAGSSFSRGPSSLCRPAVTLHSALQEMQAVPNRHYCTAVVMEYMDAGTLHTMVQRGAFGASRYVEHRPKLLALLLTALELAQGMAHLHSMDILHGDLKPTNVLLRTAGLPTLRDPRGFSAKIADLGLARTCHDDEFTPIGSEQWGALAYLAPEAAKGSCCKASDVYSFGVMLWELGAGMRPYLGLTTPQVLMGLVAGTLSLNWPDDGSAYEPLKQLGLACIAVNPAERPTFEAAGRVLSRMVEHVRQAMAPLRQRHSSALSMHHFTAGSSSNSGRNSPGGVTGGAGGGGGSSVTVNRARHPLGLSPLAAAATAAFAATSPRRSSAPDYCVPEGGNIKPNVNPLHGGRVLSEVTGG